MQSVRFSAVLLCSLVAALAGCGGGSSGAGTGSTGGSGGSGGSGGGTSFQPRPFPGDFFASPPASEYGSTFPGNVVYDSTLKEFLFSNPGMNEVEAYSSVDGHRVGAVTVPGALGLSISPDGTQLAVGTSNPYFYFVDPAALHVTGQVEVPSTLLVPGTGMEPVLPFLMAAGPMMIEEAGSIGINGNLLSYNPATGVFAQANPPGAMSGYGVSGVPARSLDGNYLAVPTAGQAGEQLSVYSAQSHTYIGATPAQSLNAVAVNPDGSQFVTVGMTSSTSSSASITFWSGSLQQQAQFPFEVDNGNSASLVVYSRDGKYLYAREYNDVLALDAQTGLLAGYQGLSIASLMGDALWDSDETNRVYGTDDLGAYVASMAQLQSTVPVIPTFQEDTYGISIGNPNEGPLSGGTLVQFTPNPAGAGTAGALNSTTEAYFNSTPATKDVVASSLTATTPAAAANGPVTVLMTDASNDAMLLPGAFSYGPHTHWINPSAVSSTDYTLSTLWADGILSIVGDGDSPAVTIGGAPEGTSWLDVLGSDTWRELKVTVKPGGSPGWADLKLTLQDGTSETTKNMVQYLAQDVTLTGPAYTSAVYDSSRDRFYLTGADNTVGVFNPETQALLQPMQSSAISPGAVLGSLTLTPDNSELLASDPTDGSVVVFNLANGTSTAVNALFTPSAPMPVAALSGNRALVLMTPYAENEVQEIDLTRMTVWARTDVQNAGQFSAPPSTMVASADGSVVLLGAEDPDNPTTYYAWAYDAASDSFSAPRPFNTIEGDSIAVSGDGTILSMGAFTLGQDLSPLVPFQVRGIVGGIEILLTGAGGLRYSLGLLPSNAGVLPLGVNYQVSVSDTHSGRELLTLPKINLPTSISSPVAFAIDPTGQKILVCAGTSLNYYELAVVPLAVGTVSPAEAAPGTTLTIRGDGFTTGTTVTIGGKSASCSMSDGQTLQCGAPNLKSGMVPMTLSNPDGQTYSLEAAVNIE